MVPDDRVTVHIIEDFFTTPVLSLYLLGTLVYHFGRLNTTTPTTAS